MPFPHRKKSFFYLKKDSNKPHKAIIPLSFNTNSTKVCDVILKNIPCPQGLAQKSITKVYYHNILWLSRLELPYLCCDDLIYFSLLLFLKQTTYSITMFIQITSLADNFRNFLFQQVIIRR